MPFNGCWLDSAWRLWGPAIAAFLITCISDKTILSDILVLGLHYRSGLSAADEMDRLTRYFINPAKAFIYLLAVCALASSLAPFVWRQRTTIWSKANLWLAAGGMAIAGILIATLAPVSFGREYGRISTDPFSQDPSQLSRRLLMPFLGHWLGLSGFLFAALFWAIVLLALTTALHYLAQKGVRLTLLGAASLATVGIFGSAFQFPGYPEILVFLLALICLLAFAQEGVTQLQSAAFALALMTHEACAVIIFLPLAVFIFGPRCWANFALLALFFTAAVAAGFGFDLSKAISMQVQVGGESAAAYFVANLNQIPLAAFLAFKLLWLVFPVALYRLARTDLKTAAFILSSLLLCLASMVIAVDYTRMVSLCSLAFLVALPAAQDAMGARALRWLLNLNLIAPSFAYNGNTGLLTFRGLYLALYKRLFHLPAPITAL